MDRITAAKVFIEVVERQSQTAAAEHLDMSRAMVSRHLKALEEWVGTRLLHRTTYPKRHTTRGLQCVLGTVCTESAYQRICTTLPPS
ncbi:LysR family transcriptional regulator [Paenalcaligenes hermetiae]|uniref:helix-turn-helix domain-containing protein n=1 Tax=Paenalcaligenes hermetiae TaxID=1157987 RepID=UPI0031EC14B5